MEKRILVVDDEQMVLDLMRTAFTKKGYTVFSALSGCEGLKILRDTNIQVIFLDLKMPEMSGLELCRKIKEQNPIACVFAVTGYASIFELAECREAGFDDYYTKPVKMEQIFKCAEDAFEKLGRWVKR